MYIPVVIHKDTDSDYGVTVPDIPGCFSVGSSFNEALSNAKEAILYHLESLLDDGISPSLDFRDIDTLTKDDEYKDGIFALVDVNLTDLTLDITRFNVSWPKYILTLLDDSLKRTHETRSGYLAKLVLEDIRKTA
ncbi:type II toxin-antitoxin system HicB family antitoxin [Providencia stuartii]|uniref:type II toxin-antitoxin system HicB family antitoxin n=1 Tax=Providencia stuartii TaxID=588 RepID=UPI003CF82C00